MHHACHLMSRSPFFFLFLVFRSLFLPKPPFSTSFSHSWNALAPFDPFKDASNTIRFLTVSLFGPTKPVHVCMTHASHMQFDVDMLKLTSNWTQSASKVTFLCQKWTQSEPKATPNYPKSFIKSLKSVGKMCVFWNPILIQPKWFHNDPKVIL